MLKYLVPLMVVAGFTSFAYAGEGECKRVATDDSGKEVWHCPIPAPPTPPVVCEHPSVGAKVMMCSGPLPSGSEPSNCGWKNGAYRCH